MAGCSQSRRIPVSGTVKDDRGDLFEGTISFLPDKETLGPAATTVVKNGRYAFTSANGPYTGLHRALVHRHSTKNMNELSHPQRAPRAGQGPWQYEVDVTAKKPDHRDFVIPADTKS